MPSILNKRGQEAGTEGQAGGGGWFLEFVLTGVLMWIVFATGRPGAAADCVEADFGVNEHTNRRKSVDFRFDGSVSIRDLVVRPHGEAEYDNSILKAETVRVRFGWAAC